MNFFFFFAFSSPLNTVLNFHQHHQPVFFLVFFLKSFFSARIWDSIICDPTRCAPSPPQEALAPLPPRGRCQAVPSQDTLWGVQRLQPGGRPAPGPRQVPRVRRGQASRRHSAARAGQSDCSRGNRLTQHMHLKSCSRPWKCNFLFIFWFLHFNRHAILKACCRPWTFNI